MSKHSISFTTDELRAIADALQFLSKSQQKSIERSHNLGCRELYNKIGYELGKASNVDQG